MQYQTGDERREASRMPIWNLLFLWGTYVVAQPKPTVATTTYSVIVRVLRPVWRKTPSVAEIKKMPGAYGNLTNTVFHPKNLNSDTEILSKLNKANPLFKFDKVNKKEKFTLVADTVWAPPKGFSLHNFDFAIIENSPTLLDRSSSKNGIKSAYSVKYPPDVIQKLRKEGQVVLGVRATLNCLVGGKPLPYLEIAGPMVLETEATVCLIYNLVGYLDTSNPQKPVVVSRPADIVLVSITEVSQ